MNARAPQYSKEEFARRGRDIYARVVEPALRPEDMGKFVAIDIDSEGYEIDHDDLTASCRLVARFPDSQTWLMRAGEVAAYRMGWRPPSGEHQ